jgi:anaerobic ribonucleoside-triphosphate reductase activating protein
MNYATIKKCDVANGPGVRVSLFVSGCSHHCKGCFNQEAWDYNYGNTFTEKEENEVMEALKPDYIKGLSLLRRRTTRP